MKKNSQALIIFVKYPQINQVKTRLGKIIGMTHAMHLYKAFVEDLLSQLNPQKYEVFIAFSPVEKSQEVQGWLGSLYQYLPQRGEDLGIKMYNAFSDVFDRKYKKIILIGSDIPHLSEDVINRGFKKLSRVPVVIGASEDGGYYLIGMNRLQEGIFRDIPWSTDKVLDETLSRLREYGKKWFSLQTMRDIDELQDLEYLKNSTKLQNLPKICAILNKIKLNKSGL